ncbi:Na+/H+ antiporter subunit A [Homoserinibacter sp. YIM 151385]|uniref:Na+/H+ antiporter subunit A n=1 Tax=Homoserinibacter sp. YIM 151385 TaxID=2985506 RepID=UPI0022F01F78|nr:Na+/H+ antiporter subunit A [Homoserinibacter sp. YIM 151385]WBU39291.1 Na+/H+ antiporter subunit A [Homoserinibacter sp. YIM 151385]
MLALLCAFALLAVLLPALTRRLGRGVFLLAAIVPAAAAVHAALAIPDAVAGIPLQERVEWVAQLDLALAFRLDALSTTMALVVGGVGALVLVYCARYFRSDEPALGRFAATFLAFAGAMYGLVVADDVFLLFVFWEATSVFSYLLIGHATGRRASRRAAMQALMVTTLGGLAMFVGLVVLWQQTGTSSLAGIVEAAPGGAPAIVGAALVVVGIVSKSALVPFHFWLPAAMAAPTPVSAYLHAAAMVKAGMYLALRMSPGLAEVPGWRESLVALGLLTMLVGAWTALRQTDLKLVLAHGTVSQLGFLVAVAAIGTRDAVLAGTALLVGHALFKSTLFLVVGVVDHSEGTRDLRKLSGLGRTRPVLAATAAAAILSMAGLPPAFGFVAKEAVLTSLLDAGEAGDALSWLALGIIVLGSALTLAYGVRFLWGAFGTKAGVERCTPGPHGRVAALFEVAPIALAAAGLLLGPVAHLADPLLGAVADRTPAEGEIAHLAFWHGLEPALAVSALSIGLGALVFALIGRRVPGAPQPEQLAPRAYRAAIRALEATAIAVTRKTQRGSLPFYLGTIFVVVVVAASTAVALSGRGLGDVREWDSPAQLAIGLLMAGAAIAATRAAKRFQAVVLVGVTGLGMASLFGLHGAPDLALTQALVEIVTLVAFVLVLRRLPARLGDQHGSGFRLVRALIGAAVGLVMIMVALVAAGARVDVPISVEWAELAVTQGHGENVVNVALVDLRGWDTMGELSVIIAAATGVASLVFLRGRADTLPRVGRREARQAYRDRRAERRTAASESSRGAWLLAGRTLAEQHRSILLEVVVRLVFHALIVLSIYLLLVGHNAPGGGFAGGLVAGLALVGRYLAGGRFELGAAAPFDAGKTLGAGLILAGGTAAVPLLFGVDALTSSWFTVPLGPLGEFDFVTSTIFDIGVYFVVIGLVLDVLRSLGAEVDRQYEDGDAGAPEPEGVRA